MDESSKIEKSEKFGLHSRSSCSVWGQPQWTSFGMFVVGPKIGENLDRRKLWKVPCFECIYLHRHLGLLLSVYVDDIKMAGTQKRLSWMCTQLKKESWFVRPSSITWRSLLECTQQQANDTKNCEKKRDFFFCGPIRRTPQVMSPKSSTRLLLQTETRRASTIRTTMASLTSQESHARTLDCSVFPQC